MTNKDIYYDKNFQMINFRKKVLKNQSPKIDRKSYHVFLCLLLYVVIA